jgi:hypothetical protein
LQKKEFTVNFIVSCLIEYFPDKAIESKSSDHKGCCFGWMIVVVVGEHILLFRFCVNPVKARV